MQVDQGLPKGDATIIVNQGTSPWIVTGGAASAVRIDEASATVTYIGEATILGMSGADAVWRIKRITISGSQTIIEWASGDAEYDKVWDNRASLSYS